MSEHLEHAGHPHQPGGDPSNAECADFLERIVRLIDNELEAGDCAVVRAHIDSCSPCLERYDLQRTVKSVVARSCSEVAPADLRARVRVQIQEIQLRLR
ncbi:mycothiol system anti-sigma-R factor [Nocardioides sp. zg-536]|uniref:Mycothiol system anti-sigma-R factor n=1 Tax=Nocardioides faecalis TaxID=2803858 RepID=A0A938Y3K1_9ACTN|nr:mycothiol system anti-sigma-R factor [Nocardioides faecalis]MBM9461236.1 mycothiol system anti-sigma-R factor [Nocardioides faecalis]MBS4752459.1 mycothiol system anti-sigma-R factor [Nocardioides faecalis]QVI57741.1 mycothiol system anti-sigma-R factor [Nocardioides faecalis]